MKKVCVTLLQGHCGDPGVGTASALPPFDKEWKAKYLPDTAPASLKEAAGTAKCNVCHEGTSKKMHNAYGKAVKKFLTKADFEAVKADPDKSKKYIDEGLDKAEAEKSAGGKSLRRTDQGRQGSAMEGSCIRTSANCTEFVRIRNSLLWRLGRDCRGSAFFCAAAVPRLAAAAHHSSWRGGPADDNSLSSGPI